MTATAYERRHRRWIRESPYQCACEASDGGRCVGDHGHAGPHMTRAEKDADNRRWADGICDALDRAHEIAEGK